LNSCCRSSPVFIYGLGYHIPLLTLSLILINAGAPIQVRTTATDGIISYHIFQYIYFNDLELTLKEVNMDSHVAVVAPLQYSFMASDTTYLY
jgi:hypothetical protein